MPSLRATNRARYAIRDVRCQRRLESDRLQVGADRRHYASFTPDVAGKYTVTETKSAATFDVHAGTWQSIITGWDKDAGLEIDAACTACHNGTLAADAITP
jgi:hypothetical protein